MRYRLDVAYHGRDFHGWQKQPGLRTVQGELEVWLSRFLGDREEVALTGAGRTDTGVHALALPAHFDWPEPIDTVALHHRLRVALPHDLAILSFHRVADDFHARYSAIARRYVYRVRRGAWPFNRDRDWQVHGELAIDRLHACAAIIRGTQDFSGFCRALSLKENNRCSVTHSEWRTEGDNLTYRIRADRFLHQMVRLIVGTSVAVARGQGTPERLREILTAGDVTLCGDAAPPHGLTLEAVEYPDGVGEPLDFD
ncbi:MAG TPA: tRNA pseudouridine(38-40) synthase TruA [bacterium]|nr:tRNA pseudouridine(38-40) synthase TruA [bacterium]